MKKRLFSKLAVFLMIMLALTFTLSACGQQEAAPEEPEETVEPADTPNVTGTVTTFIDMTQYEKGKVVKVWVPVALSNEDQSVDNAGVIAPEGTYQLTTDELGNQMAYIEWGADVDPESRRASVYFHASRNEVKIAPEDMVEDGEVGDDMAEFLEGSEMVVVDGVVKEQADEITANETTVLGKARAIYDWVYDNMVRDNDVIGCGQGDVCQLLDTKAGKCTDINSVFVALCRASGIPAREMFGIRMNADNITGNQHCWAQFYLPGTGWVYADPADVLKAVLTNNWAKDDPEALETKEYYWGGVDEKRVELSRGRDLTLSPAQEGPALNDFGYPYAEIDGQPVDFYKPSEFVYSISFVADSAIKEVSQRTVYVTPSWVKSVIDGQQEGYEDYVIAEVAYGAEPETSPDYNTEHIPGAIHVGIVEVEDATGSEEGAYNLLPADEVTANLLSHGITKDTKVILYGQDICGVGRQAYAYIWAGVEDVKILNGGINAWKAAGYEIDKEPHTGTPAEDFGVEAPAHPEYWVSAADALDRLTNDDNFKLVSIRAEAEWLGETSGYGYMDKAGEPDGAVWGRGALTAADVAEFVNDNGTVKDLAGLQEVWADADFTLDNDLAFYCGTGWRATVPFLVLYENGYDNIAVFDGGWYEWLMHDDYPVQVGDPASADCVHTTVGELETGKAAKE